MSRARIERAIAAVARGEFVVVADDHDRENEGDLICASETCTAAAIAFMTRQTSGVICVSLTSTRTEQLELPPMVPNTSDPHRTAFTVSVDYRHGTTTGISAHDRAATIRSLTDPRTRPDDLTRPGHIFPLRANDRGVLGRRGHTEAAVDLARLAGLAPSGVLCELVHDDGTMVRGPELEAFARRYELEFLTIEDLVAYRRAESSLAAPVVHARPARTEPRAPAPRFW